MAAWSGVGASKGRDLGLMGLLGRSCVFIFLKRFGFWSSGFPSSAAVFLPDFLSEDDPGGTLRFLSEAVCGVAPFDVLVSCSTVVARLTHGSDGSESRVSPNLKVSADSIRWISLVFPLHLILDGGVAS